MEGQYPIGGYAPGNYIKICMNCDVEFMGDKRAVQCEPCAIDSIKRATLIDDTEIMDFMEALMKTQDVKHLLKDSYQKEFYMGEKVYWLLVKHLMSSNLPFDADNIFFHGIKVIEDKKLGAYEIILIQL